MKKSIKFPLIVCIAVVVVVISAALLCFALFGPHRLQVYYTQIDNSRIRENHSSGGVIDFTGGLAYTYALPCYDEDGRGENLEFGMSRELREGALLRLEVLPLRGVMNWEEVQYDELPPAVQVRYEAP